MICNNFLKIDESIYIREAIRTLKLLLLKKQTCMVLNISAYKLPIYQIKRLVTFIYLYQNCVV